MDLTGQNPAWQQKMAYISGTCDCYSQEEYQLVDLYFVNLLGKKPNWANRYQETRPQKVKPGANGKVTNRNTLWQNRTR